jgi:transcriptional regulator with XRE-family HTH domain|nr:helix-turn-helix transcriptional regulator [uncultured Acetatifactor sp.]
MPELNLVLLGKRIRDARKECGLTQKELADQTGLAAKTIQDIENGRKNPTYDTLARLMGRLGISPDTLFLLKSPVPDEEIKHFLENYQSCNPKGREILFKTLHFLAEQLRPTQDEPD